VTVLPSNKVTYLKGSHLLEKGTEESVSMKIWKRASMSFENIPVSEVIRQLNKRFSINISTEDTEISNYVLTADFSDQNLPDIMEMLERSLNISYELGSKNIVLKKTKKPIK
jgi:ferric-dicitrate binding protein FerR (iron transport regulator)